MKSLFDNIFIFNIPFALLCGFFAYIFEDSNSDFLELLIILHSTLCLICLLFSILIVIVLFLIFNLGSLGRSGIIGILPLIYRLLVFLAECTLCPITFMFLVEQSVNYLTFFFLTTQIFVVLIVSVNFIKDLLANPPVSNSIYETESQKSLYSIDEQELNRIEIEVQKARERFPIK
jgi:hypothetical protein